MLPLRNYSTTPYAAPTKPSRPRAPRGIPPSRPRDPPYRPKTKRALQQLLPGRVRPRRRPLPARLGLRAAQHTPAEHGGGCRRRKKRMRMLIVTKKTWIDPEEIRLIHTSWFIPGCDAEMIAGDSAASGCSFHDAMQDCHEESGGQRLLRAGGAAPLGDGSVGRVVRRDANRETLSLAGTRTKLTRHGLRLSLRCVF